MSDIKLNDPEKVVIIGTGPAGYTAALYAARANMEPLVFDGILPGGQLMITTDVDNYPGFPEGIMGPDLMLHMRAQCERFGTRYASDVVEEVDFSSWPYTVKGGSYEVKAQTVIIATGASAKYLGLPNEERLQKSGGGVSACATCDGFFYQGVDLAVVGGGDSACEEATFLTKFASKVYMLVRRDQLRASKIMQNRALKNDKIEILWNTSVEDVLGDTSVTGLAIVNNKSGEKSTLPVGGMFLAIGHVPNSQPFQKWLPTDEAGYILTRPGQAATEIPGVFAAGDIQDHVYRQAITAAGSGCMAALEAERWLETRLEELAEAAEASK